MICYLPSHVFVINLIMCLSVLFSCVLVTRHHISITLELSAGLVHATCCH